MNAAEAAAARGTAGGREPVDRVHSHQGDDGRFHLHAELGALEGAEVQAALQEARDALFRAGNRDVTWADALVEVCRRSLAATGSVSRADNYRVYVHVDTKKAWVNAGPLLPESVRSRLLCDSTIHPFFVTGGKPISVGRVTHTIPRHTRRAVLDRDTTCRFPGCNRRQLEVHHLVHREHGGHTVTENLAGFCTYHHHRHHDGTFRVSGNADEPDGLAFHRSDGSVMRPGPDPTRPQGPPPSPPPGHRYVHPAGERIQGKWVHFNETPTAA